MNSDKNEPFEEKGCASLELKECVNRVFRIPIFLINMFSEKSPSSKRSIGGRDFMRKLYIKYISY
jgi:hypothetical protein